ncbi:MAG TPA: hypothetical protein VL588_08310 [Bdellovibrionota bacterium]|jgi:hypothetical protein|nr:hypothetical protein [Bdellovibrionota bacterium]
MRWNLSQALALALTLGTVSAPAFGGQLIEISDINPGTADQPTPAADSSVLCGGIVDPHCEQQVENLIKGMRLLHPSIEGGVEFSNGLAGGAIRFGMDVVGLNTPTGDLELIRFAALYLPDAGGVRLRIKLAETEAQFFCKDADSGESHAPFTAMFNHCVPEGMVGVSGELLDFQWDIQSSRLMARWLEANVVMNFLNNSNSEQYLGAHLMGFLGASLDTGFNVPGESGVAVMPRLNMGVTGTLRTLNNHLQIEGYAGFRPNMADFSDYGLEGDVKVLYNFLFSPNVMGQVGVHASASYWSVPSHSIGEFASDHDAESIYVGGLFQLLFR